MLDPTKTFFLRGGDELAVDNEARRGIRVVSVKAENGHEKSRKAKVEGRKQLFIKLLANCGEDREQFGHLFVEILRVATGTMSAFNSNSIQYCVSDASFEPFRFYFQNRHV